MKRSCAVILAAALLMLAPSSHAAEMDNKATGPLTELTTDELIEIDQDTAKISAAARTQGRNTTETLRREFSRNAPCDRADRSEAGNERDIQTPGTGLDHRYDHDRQSERRLFRGYQGRNGSA